MRTFITIVFFLGLGFLTSCGESKKQSSVVVSSAFALTATDIEMVLVGKNHSTQMGFSKVFTGELSMILDNGDWEFNIISWEKDALNGPFTGANRCGKARQLLSGSDSTVRISVDAISCLGLSDDTHLDAAYQFQTLDLSGCDSIVGISSYSTPCSTSGPATSFSIGVIPYEYSPFASPDLRHLGTLKSFCASSPLLKLPARTNFKFPIIIKAHVAAGCASSVGDETYVFPEGLDTIPRAKLFKNGSIQRLVLLNPLPVDSAPVSYAISPPNFNEDTQTIITLPYNDPDGDQATSCAIAALSNVTVTLPCNCTVGVCTVGVTGNTDFVGFGSFDYKVQTNSLYSSFSTVSLTIDAVNDPPVIAISDPTAAINENKLVNFTITDVDSIVTCSNAHVTSIVADIPSFAPVISSVTGTAPNCLVYITAGSTPGVNTGITIYADDTEIGGTSITPFIFYISL